MDIGTLIIDAVNSKLGIAIITGGLGYIAKLFWENRTYHLVGARRNALAGKWTGRATQELEGASRTWVMEITLKPGLQRIRGDGFLIFDPQDRSKDQHFTMAGGFQHDRFLKLEYRNKKHYKIQFGSILFYFDEEGETLNGEYVGFGHKSKKVNHGTIVLDTKSA
jgi:hypothetical protein